MKQVNKAQTDPVPGKNSVASPLSLLEAAFDAITDFVILLSPDHKIININRAGCEALKFRKEDLIGKKCFHVVHCTEEPISECPCEMSMKTLSPQFTEYESGGRQYALSAWPVLSGDKEVVALIHIVKDTTEVKQAEKTVFEAKTEWESVFNTLSDMITIHDKDFNIIRANKAAGSILGLPFLGDETGVKCYMKYHGTDSPPEGCPSCNCLVTGLPLTSEIFEPHLNKYIEVRAIPRTDQEGQLNGLIHVVRDISERKNAEAELIKAKERAEESDRLKSAFLANVSHEIRTPLNAIAGFTGLLSDPDLTREEYLQYSEIIKSRTDDLLQIINDIIEISRIESGNSVVMKETLALNDLLDELKIIFLNKLGRLKKKSVQLVCENHLPPQQTGVITDGYIARQVFSNLLDNAIKFTESGLIRFGYQMMDKGVIACFVSDTGIGIAPEKQGVIFEHFRQADISDQQKYGGNGLGLSICRGSLSLIGGKIRVESSPGNGSTFYFTLPFELASAQAQDSGVMPAGKGKVTVDWSEKKLLLVEDEESNMEFLKIILGRTGAALVCAGSGGELRNLYPELHEIDCVLLDIRLPDASGWDLIKEIKKIRPGLPVIAQTAHALENDKQKSLEAGFDDYISKPISKDLLFKILSGFLTKSEK